MQKFGILQPIPIRIGQGSKNNTSVPDVFPFSSGIHRCIVS